MTINTRYKNENRKPEEYIDTLKKITLNAHRLNVKMLTDIFISVSISPLAQEGKYYNTTFATNEKLSYR